MHDDDDDMEQRVRENRLRRAAKRQGLRLVKSRRRDPRALDYGRYWLLDSRNRLLSGNPYRDHSATLDEVEKYLYRDEPFSAASG